MSLSPNVEMVCKTMQLRMDIGKAGYSPATCLSDIKDLERIREVIEAYEAVKQPPERVKFYFHAPRANKLTECKMTFKDMEDAVKTLHCMTNLDQYVAVLEYKGDVSRYLVTKGAGSLAVIPMENNPGWSKEQEQISNVVNFVLGTHELPFLVCEENDE